MPSVAVVKFTYTFNTTQHDLAFKFDANMSGAGALDASDLVLNNATRDTFVSGATLSFTNGTIAPFITNAVAHFKFPASQGEMDRTWVFSATATIARHFHPTTCRALARITEKILTSSPGTRTGMAWSISLTWCSSFPFKQTCETK